MLYPDPPAQESATDPFPLIDTDGGEHSPSERREGGVAPEPGPDDCDTRAARAEAGA